jgi:hypothetical protein
MCCKSYLRLVGGKLLTPTRQNSQLHNKAVLYNTLRDSVTFYTFENIREEMTAEKSFRERRSVCERMERKLARKLKNNC